MTHRVPVLGCCSCVDALVQVAIAGSIVPLVFAVISKLSELYVSFMVCCRRAVICDCDGCGIKDMATFTPHTHTRGRAQTYSYTNVDKSQEMGRGCAWCVCGRVARALLELDEVRCSKSMPVKCNEKC